MLRYHYNEASGPLHLQEAGEGVLNVQVFSAPADQPGLSPVLVHPASYINLATRLLSSWLQTHQLY